MDSKMKEWFSLFDKPNKKLKIYYTPEAYMKTRALVRTWPVEIGWNMVIKPYKDGYLVSNILVYPQKTSPAYIEVDPGKYGMWKAELSDEEDSNLFGHGHSHVNMDVFASGTDLRQQFEETMLKNKGFYLFQIWNKKNRVNSTFYDLDNKILYLNPDIDLLIDFQDMSYEEFIRKSFCNVSKMEGDPKITDEFEQIV